MPLIFRSNQGPWSVWSCDCGCGDAVRFRDDQERDWVRGQRVYLTNHAPLGCPYERKGQPYDFTAEPPNSPVVTSDVYPSLAVVDDERTPAMASNALWDISDDYLAEGWDDDGETY